MLQLIKRYFLFLSSVVENLSYLLMRLHGFLHSVDHVFFLFFKFFELMLLYLGASSDLFHLLGTRLN